MDNKKEIMECVKCKQKFDILENNAICPNCGYNNRAAINKNLGCGCLISFFVILIFIFVFAISTNETNSPEQPNPTEKSQKKDEVKWIISTADYGANYPYTEDNLTIYCYKNAVWLEDAMSNRYALNGFAMNLLKNKKNYKGTTEKILKPNKADVYLPAEAQQYCIMLTDGEFNAIK